MINKGGVKALTVAQITETSKVIKEKMDIEIREILASFELTSDFFITSKSIRKVWGKCFQPDQFRVPFTTFIEGFEDIIGKEILSSHTDPALNQRRLDNLKTLLTVQPDSYNGNELSINLDCLVNQTDFIELGTLLRMLEVDLLDECIEKVRSETAVGIENAESVAKIQESINAKYGQNSSESRVKL